ncbi:MAG: nitrous oxide reductase family maturation protein NosD [Promethearchaeota archaeon]
MRRTKIKIILITALLIYFTFKINCLIDYDQNPPTESMNELFSIRSSWDSGNGTYENPYILENKTFLGGSSNGYSLTNVNYYFIIRNCTFIGSGSATDNAGLRLVGVENGVIMNNTFSSCQNGILFSAQIGNCRNNVVINNTFEGNINGIRIASLARKINITTNRFRNNNDGIEIFGCNENHMFNNFGQLNGDGIHILGGSDNKIIGNKLINNIHSGIYFENSIDNTLIGNIISNNDIGILFDYSRTNIISGNTITSHTWGIWFQNNANNNVVYNNTFAINGEHVHIINSVNSFDNGVLGNFWDDYEGFDCDNDGIGETSYESGGVIDRYPICYILDTFLPNITIVNLKDGDIFGQESPSFTLLIQEYLLDSQWYQIDNSGPNYPFSGLSGTIDQDVWDSLSAGRHNITFYAQDKANNIGYAEVYVIKQVDEPTSISIGFFPWIFVILAIIGIVWQYKTRIQK